MQDTWRVKDMCVWGCEGLKRVGAWGGIVYDIGIKIGVVCEWEAKEGFVECKRVQSFCET
jgi:hypothetical protein